MTGPDLRATRERMGLSRYRLAKLLDVSESTLLRWERGDMAINSPAMLARALRDLERERGDA